MITFVATIDVAQWISHVGNRDQISIHREAGLEQLRSGLKPLVNNEFLKASENLLLSAQLEIEQELSLLGRNLIQVNLVWVEGEETIVVAARSKPGDCPRKHP